MADRSAERAALDWVRVHFAEPIAACHAAFDSADQAERDVIEAQAKLRAIKAEIVDAEDTRNRALTGAQQAAMGLAQAQKDAEAAASAKRTAEVAHQVTVGELEAKAAARDKELTAAHAAMAAEFKADIAMLEKQRAELRKDIDSLKAKHLGVPA